MTGRWHLSDGARIIESRAAQKSLDRTPKEVVSAYEIWARLVEEHGTEILREEMRTPVPTKEIRFEPGDQSPVPLQRGAIPRQKQEGFSQ